MVMAGEGRRKIFFAHYRLKKLISFGEKKNSPFFL
jgi:hypothetical protein